MEVTEKRQVKQFGHLRRRTDTHIPKMVYKSEQEGRRHKEQKPMFWKQDIHQITRNLEIKGSSIQRLMEGYYQRKKKLTIFRLEKSRYSEENSVYFILFKNTVEQIKKGN